MKDLVVEKIRAYFLHKPMTFTGWTLVAEDIRLEEKEVALLVRIDNPGDTTNPEHLADALFRMQARLQYFALDAQCKVLLSLPSRKGG